MRNTRETSLTLSEFRKKYKSLVHQHQTEALVDKWVVRLLAYGSYGLGYEMITKETLLLKDSLPYVALLEAGHAVTNKIKNTYDSYHANQAAQEKKINHQMLSKLWHALGDKRYALFPPMQSDRGLDEFIDDQFYSRRGWTLRDKVSARNRLQTMVLLGLDKQALISYADYAVRNVSLKHLNEVALKYTEELKQDIQNHNRRKVVHSALLALEQSSQSPMLFSQDNRFVTDCASSLSGLVSSYLNEQNENHINKIHNRLRV